MGEANGTREMTAAEIRLVRWMLEHGGDEAQPFLAQLDEARVLPGSCPCGCQSLAFAVNGHPQHEGTTRPLADFLFGHEHDLSGVFVFERGGVLAGLTIYGLAGEPQICLPAPEAMHLC